MRLYHIGAIAKIILGLIVALVLYNTINIYEDPAIGIGFGLVSVLLFSWGVSFYFFWFVNSLAGSKDDHMIVSDSYKMSLLFGFFCLINVILLLLSIWTKILGGLLFVGFLILYIAIFSQQVKVQHDR